MPGENGNRGEWTNSPVEFDNTPGEFPKLRELRIPVRNKRKPAGAGNAPAGFVDHGTSRSRHLLRRSGGG